MEKIFVDSREFRNIFVTVLSFGFKNGIPADADLVFDVRFLPNPYYVENLKQKTRGWIRRCRSMSWAMMWHMRFWQSWKIW